MRVAIALGANLGDREAAFRFAIDRLAAHERYIRQSGEDMPEIRDWIWSHRAR